ncbi:MAG: serine/threonine-protein kinase [Polyangiaceae bacterium]
MLRELGRGGMGAVYLVEHVHTGDHLALKVLQEHAGADATMVERFRREARAPGRIRSENVVRVTDADVAPELGGAPFLVMELLNGCDLEHWLEAQGPMSPAQLMPILRDIARALDKAHSLGIVHRDLKPENLFWHLREDGTRVIKILDFGIAKATGHEMSGTGQLGLTKSGAIFGTPLYMSPEQALGYHDRVCPQTDQWALGLIVYRLLTGDVYWTGDTLAALAVQIIAEPMPPPSSRVSSLPPGFDAWFMKSCHRDAAARFSSVSEQVAVLAQVFGDVERAPAVVPALPHPQTPSLIEAGEPRDSLVQPQQGTIYQTSHATGMALSHTQGAGKSVSRTRLPIWMALGALILVVGVVVAVLRASPAQPELGVEPPLQSETASAPSEVGEPPPSAASSATAAPPAPVVAPEVPAEPSVPVRKTRPPSHAAPKIPTPVKSVSKPVPAPAPATSRAEPYEPLAP